MSHFYATIEGGRTPATRTGHKNTGISGHVKGWNVGIRAAGYHDKQTGKDMFCVYATGGSNGRTAETLIACVTEDAELVDRTDVEHFNA